MSEKPKISARETYVLDEDQLKELDEASLTGVMRDVTESIKKLELAQQEQQPTDDDSDDDLFRSLRVDD